MAKIAVRCKMNRKNKIYGQLPDRFIMGRTVVNLDFSMLNLLDKKRDFKFLDRKLSETSFKTNNIFFGAADTTTVQSLLKKIIGPDTEAMDRHTPPIFYSSCMSCFRDICGAYGGDGSFLGDLLGNFKGPDPIYTIDNTGNAGDFLAPGTQLLVSYGGLLHKVIPNEEIEPFIIPESVTTARLPFYTTNNANGHPLTMGYNLYSCTQGKTDMEVLYPFGYSPVVSGIVGRWGYPVFSKLIYQNSSVLVYMQLAGGSKAITNWQYVASPTAPPDHIEIISINKSTGVMTDVVLAANIFPTGFGMLLHKELTTTEATPQKACIIFSLEREYKSTLFINKIINGVLTNICKLVNPLGVSGAEYPSYSYETIIPTRIMEFKTAANSTFLKFYMFGTAKTDNTVTIHMIKFAKTLTQAATTTPCTLVGLPTEYASSDGVHIKSCPSSLTQNSRRFDCTWTIDIYDESDQYVAIWIGRTRDPWHYTDIDSYSYSEMSDTKYRYLLIFKVDPTDDSRLIYQSCVSEIKTAKPIHCAVASEDNKFLALANPDGLFCLVWSSISKTFVLSDALALPGIVSMGMDKTQGPEKATVFIETLDSLTVGDDCTSTVQQIDFGNYKGIDIRYNHNGTYISDFGYVPLTLSKDVDGNYITQTKPFEVRVKNRVDGIETEFLTGQTVRLKIIGVKESDGVSFVDSDSGNPYQKTITTTDAWSTCSFNYKQPISNMKITSEII